MYDFVFTRICTLSYWVNYRHKSIQILSLHRCSFHYKNRFCLLSTIKLVGDAALPNESFLTMLLICHLKYANLAVAIGNKNMPIAVICQFTLNTGHTQLDFNCCCYIGYFLIYYTVHVDILIAIYC